MGYKLHVEKKHRRSLGGRGKAGPDGLPTETVDKGKPYGRQLRSRYVEPGRDAAVRTATGRRVNALEAPSGMNAAQRLLMRLGVPQVPPAGGRSEHLHATRGRSTRRA